MESIATEERISVEVAYAKAFEQRIITAHINPRTTVLDAVKQSGIADYFPEIDLDNLKLGIYGKSVLKPEAQVVKPGDRIEIYRPLIADPKEVRKKRAEQAKLKRQE
ncbi:RnfH family protein [Endozoicomonas sp. (ex Bugula neritina AB1)]|nr:RnfH family protein [Endozoicomonas sp. (ex Bugula neritina AB1)]